MSIILRKTQEDRKFVFQEKLHHVYILPKTFIREDREEGIEKIIFE